MELYAFLLKTILISLSGVMAPGAVTAATIAQGTQRRWAGTLISIGHGIIEIPLIFLLMVGLHLFFENPTVKVIIGLVGGAFLLWMGVGLLREINKPDSDPQNLYTAGPVATGFILSATNPYFLFWWATVGMSLAAKSLTFGVWAFVIFAVLHWLCDLVWLEALSIAGHRGSSLLGPRSQPVILGVCGTALLGIGLSFLFDAGLAFF